MANQNDLKNYSFTLNEQDLGIIQAGLNEIPHKFAQPVLMKIGQQIAEQEKAKKEAIAKAEAKAKAKAAADKKPEAVPAVKKTGSPEATVVDTAND